MRLSTAYPLALFVAAVCAADVAQPSPSASGDRPAHISSTLSDLGATTSPSTSAGGGLASAFSSIWQAASTPLKAQKPSSTTSEDTKSKNKRPWWLLDWKGLKYRAFDQHKAASTDPDLQLPWPEKCKHVRCPRNLAQPASVAEVETEECPVAYRKPTVPYASEQRAITDPIQLACCSYTCQPTNCGGFVEPQFFSRQAKEGTSATATSTTTESVKVDGLFYEHGFPCMPDVSVNQMILSNNLTELFSYCWRRPGHGAGYCVKADDPLYGWSEEEKEDTQEKVMMMAQDLADEFQNSFSTSITNTNVHGPTPTTSSDSAALPSSIVEESTTSTTSWTSPMASTTFN